MKKIFAILLVPTLFLPGCLKEPEVSFSSFPGTKVILRDRNLQVDDQSLSIPFTDQDLISVLGEPDRVLKLANTISVWDRLGIYAYRNPEEPEIHDISFSYSPEEFDFIPKTRFTGAIRCGELVLHGKTNGRDLLQRGFDGHQKISTEYSADAGVHAIYVKTDPKARGLKDVSLALRWEDVPPTD